MDPDVQRTLETLDEVLGTNITRFIPPDVSLNV